MIFRFKVTSMERADFLRELDIQGEQTLYDLHMCIQNDLDYDDSQPVVFYTADSSWKRGQAYSLFGQGGSELMDEVSLGSLVRAKHHRLIYKFDVHNGRTFRLELLSMEEPSPRVKYPCVGTTKGEPPMQIGDANSTFSSLFDQAMPDFDADMYASSAPGSGED
ncbi:MAG: plasmid pRiA4b ORF-3 family protein [Prevotellaceae bacterium]|jgi:hypothetical protein|nr:plasmid pRiA4b ORF-3 family protein [Prevotellaceae bacterium]